MGRTKHELLRCCSWCSALLFFYNASLIGAFVPAPSSPSVRPAHAVRTSLQKSVGVLDENSTGERQVVVQQVSLDDDNELERMSEFCIDGFYRREEDEARSPLSR